MGIGLAIFGVIVGGVLALGAGGAALFIYWRFSKSAAKRWRDAVFHLLEAARQQAGNEHQQDDKLEKGQRGEHPCNLSAPAHLVRTRSMRWP